MKILVLFALLSICILAEQITLVGFTVDYTISDDKSTINFKIEGTNPDKGSIAFAVGGSGMKNVDVAAFMYSGGKVVVEDRTYINGSNAVVPLDSAGGGADDWKVDDANSSYSETEGKWKISFSRKLKTGDKPNMDNDIELDKEIQFSMVTFDDGMTWGNGIPANHKHKQSGTKKVSFSDENSESVILKASAFLIAGLLLLF